MTEYKRCAICGKKIKINNYQSRKKICHKCSYELKKLRMALAYSIKKKSPRLNLYKKQLEVYNQLIKNK
jgi:ribosomal protein L37E